MKLFIEHLDPKKLKLDKFKDLDFSLYVQTLPRSKEDLSSINIIAINEPSGYFDTTPWILQNSDLFSAILTWDIQILNNCKNAFLLPFGHSWFLQEQYEKIHEKKFEISHLSGVLNKTYGHSMRHEILSRQNEFNIPINFHKTIGDRNNIEDARIGKETVFGNSMFGIAIENFSHRNFFTEKLLDCFLMRTIPIYWGCSNIEEFFFIDGIIRVNNADDIISISNKLTESDYNQRKEVIEKNYQAAIKYINYEQNVVDSLELIFKTNNLI